MPFHIFKSKQSKASKSNTLKKAEHSKNHSPVQQDARPDDGDQIVDITNVGAWVEENAAKNGSSRGDAVLKGKSPHRATLVSELDATHTSVNSQEANREQCDKEETLENDTTDTADDEPQLPMSELILGRQDPSSSYFTQRHIIIPTAAIPSADRAKMSIEDISISTLPDLDPYAFEIYQIWLYSGTISSRCQLPFGSDTQKNHSQMWSICWPLLNAHILGCKIDAPNFADQVMDLLEKQLSGSSTRDIDIIKHLFTKGDEMPRALKAFVADKYIDGRIGGLSDVDINTLPPAFLRLTLQRALIRLSDTAPTSSASSCKYHTHATPESCYKQNIPPHELRRQQRLHLDRQKSSNDAQEVMRNFQENDIKTVDWEERKAKALRATTLQTTLIEDALGPLQTDGASDDVEKVVPGQNNSNTSASSDKAAEVTRLLHPSLAQDAYGNLRTSSTLPPVSEEEIKTEPHAGRWPTLPGAFPSF